jgi:hypothetical protein
MIVKVVDTNVAIAANGRHTHEDLNCQLACIDKLSWIVENAVVAIDGLGLILDEYSKHLRFEGAPGVGDQFFKHVFDNQSVSAKCQVIGINQEPGNTEDFVEFPKTNDLRHFDKSDRKFVAVSLASPDSPAIVNATDSDWSEYADPLAHVGIIIEQLCPQHAERN